MYAYEKHVADIRVAPAFVGSFAASDVNFVLYKCYQQAIRSLPEWLYSVSNYKFYARGTISTDRESGVSISTTYYSKKDYASWYVDFVNKVAARFMSIKGASFKSFIMDFHFIAIPAGAGLGSDRGTESREVESILAKTSVNSNKERRQLMLLAGYRHTVS